jgi:hypothetical protein
MNMAIILVLIVKSIYKKKMAHSILLMVGTVASGVIKSPPAISQTSLLPAGSFVALH